MAAYRILICGGGFAGLAAAWRLSRARGVSVTLLDARAGSEFLPLLPDVIGRGLPPGVVVYPFSEAARRWGFAFHQTRILQIDPQRKEVQTQAGTFEADALLLTTGSESYPPPGVDAGFAGDALRLDSVEDALTIRRAVLAGDARTWVVCGGGYTGVEVASHIRHALRKTTTPPRICLVTNTDRLCPAIRPPFSLYIQKELTRIGIEVLTDETVCALEGNTVRTASGMAFPDARLVWTVGVQGAEVTRTMPVPLEAQGRVAVDPCLRVMPGVFAAGDAAGFRVEADGTMLRMGIQASISGGWHAAGNLLRERDGKGLRPFHPFDPGYVVPMAHGKGCGTPMGMPIRGRAPVWLHYFMSWVRTWGVGHRLSLLRAGFCHDREGRSSSHPAPPSP